MLDLALWLKRNGFRPDQVQAFLPTPHGHRLGHVPHRPQPIEKRAAAIREKVSVVRKMRQRRLHKAFLRWHDPNNWPLLREALKAHGPRRPDRQRQAPSHPDVSSPRAPVSNRRGAEPIMRVRSGRQGRTGSPPDPAHADTETDSRVRADRAENGNAVFIGQSLVYSIGKTDPTRSVRYDSLAMATIWPITAHARRAAGQCRRGSRPVGLCRQRAVGPRRVQRRCRVVTRAGTGADAGGGLRAGHRPSGLSGQRKARWGARLLGWAQADHARRPRH